MRCEPCCFNWSRMHSAWDEKGSVTAELMMLMPALILGVGIAGAIFSTSLERITLERDTAAALRELSIGRELEIPPGVTARSWSEGRLICVEFKKTSLFDIASEHCALPLA